MGVPEDVDLGRSLDAPGGKGPSDGDRRMLAGQQRWGVRVVRRSGGQGEDQAALGVQHEQVDIGAGAIVKPAFARLGAVEVDVLQVAVRLVLGHVELLVELAVEEGPKGRIGQDLGHREAEDQQDGHGDREAPAQPHRGTRRL